MHRIGKWLSIIRDCGQSFRSWIFTGWRSQRDAIVNQFNEILKIESRLSGRRKIIERQYLDVANELGIVITSGFDLVSHSEKLAELDAGPDGIETASAEIDRALSAPLDVIDHACLDMTKLVERLRDDQDILEGILGIDERIEEILSPLKFIQTHFRIECSRFSHDIQDRFSSLVEEIYQANSIFYKLLPRLAEIRENIGSATGRIDELIEKQKIRSEEKRALIQESIERIGQRISRNREHNREIVEFSNVINQKTSAVTIALQRQDALNQKLQHIEEAIAKMGDQVAQLKEARRRSASPSAISGVKQLSKVIPGQVDSVKQDLTEMEHDIWTNLANIGDDAEILNTGSGKEVKNDRDLPQVVSGTVDEVISLLDEIHSDSNYICQHFDSIRNLTSDLPSALQELAIEIHIVGLNSQIKAAGIQNGNSLEELAAQTSEISQHVGAMSEQVFKDIQTFDANLKLGVDSVSKINEGVTQELEKLRDFRSDLVSKLTGLLRASMDALDKVSSEMESLSKHSKEAIDLSRIDAMAFQSLTDLEQSVTHLSAKACEVADKKDIQSCDVLISNELLSSYTMESERKIHLEALRDDSPADTEVFFDSDDDLALEDSDSNSSTEKSRLSGKAAESNQNVDLWLD